jgi:D-alanyl-D-alanine carboxypeptidase
MGTPPLIIPPDRARRRWRPRARTLAAGAAVLACAAAVAAALGVFSPARQHAVRRAGSARLIASATRSASPPPRPRSALGLVLGTRALALRGLGAPAQEPLQIRFRHPPHAGLLFDLDSGTVLWQRNPLRRVRVASLTKMMTALLAVRTPPRGGVFVTKEAVETPGSKVGVLPRGRRVPFESMLYGMLLPSGNDAAVALAHAIAGSVNAFVARMNVEAARLGLGCTRFSSPSGYFDEGNFSCAADLADLAHVDLSQPRIAHVARSATAVLPFPIKGGKLYLYNNNPLLIYGYPGVTGLKTGYTTAAGRCLVATAERHGVRLGVVLLNSPAPATEARQLLDLGFERVYHQRPEPERPIPPEA